MSDTSTRATPSALPPSEAELAEWDALTRDEQVALYRQYLAHPDCDTFTTETPEDILVVARAVVAARQRG